MCDSVLTCYLRYQQVQPLNLYLQEHSCIGAADWETIIISSLVLRLPVLGSYRVCESLASMMPSSLSLSPVPAERADSTPNSAKAEHH
jgi:hypothetical protein